jgi:hypothetical protein
MSSNTREEIENASRSLDRLNFIKFVKEHSNEIIQKLSEVARRSTPHYRLLSLTNPSDSIREEIFKYGCILSKARLGDSTSIAHYINEYVSFRDREHAKFSNKGMRYYLNILLSFGSKMALDTIFSDVQSSRIITTCSRPNEEYPDCPLTSYTYLFSIIEVLMTKHLDEPVLNRRFNFPFVKISYPKNDLPPQLPDFFKALEDFILREYGYTVKINVPFVIAGEEE